MKLPFQFAKIVQDYQINCLIAKSLIKHVLDCHLMAGSLPNYAQIDPREPPSADQHAGWGWRRLPD